MPADMTPALPAERKDFTGKQRERLYQRPEVMPSSAAGNDGAAPAKTRKPFSSFCQNNIGR